MGELLLWLLAATALCLLAGWQLRRRRVDAKRARAAEQQRAEQQAERERAVAAELEHEAQRLAALHAEQQRRAADRAAAEREAAAQAERERLAAERAEHERLAAEQVEHEQLAAEQARHERLAAEQARHERLVAERERLAAEQVQREAQRIAAEQARQEAQRIAAERAQHEAQRIAAEQEQARRQAAWRAEQQRLAAERAEAERQAAEAADEARRLAEQSAARAVPPRVPKSAAQTLVLVADDSKVVRIKTGRLLAQHQYRVGYAGDGLDALQQMHTEVPDVLITDVEMPGMDGFELTRHIRGNPQTAQLPVIMITAADERHREQADAAGVSVLLGKPYAEEELLAHIRRALGQQAAPPQAADALDALA